MKTHTAYECETCGLKGFDRDEVEAHENAHVTIDGSSIVELRYEREFLAPPQYRNIPSAIVVEFATSKGPLRFEYRRCGVILDRDCDESDGPMLSFIGWGSK